MNSATSTMVVARPSALAARYGPDQPRPGVGDGRAGAGTLRAGALGVRALVGARRRRAPIRAVEDGGAPHEVRRDALRLQRHRRPTPPLVFELAGVEPPGDDHR